MKTNASRYHTMSTRELAAAVVNNADVNAIAELVQNRKLFVWENRKRMNLAEYVRLRCEWIANRFSSDVLDRAYETAIDRFHNLRQEESECAAASGIDCRNYYRAYLARLPDHENNNRLTIREDLEDERTFQEFVSYHFGLALREAIRRCNGYAHRYTWNIDGQSIVLMMPRSMVGDEKPSWLSENIDPALLRTPHAQRRIQAVVDEKLLCLYPTKLKQQSLGGVEARKPADRWSFEHEVSTKGLALAIADEKVSIIDELRPSIRRLGAANLRSLIIEVFDGLANGGYDEGKTASRYRLSKSSFSRFCGGRWKKSSNGTGAAHIPDLWANLAGLLSASTEFREAAKSAGVWQTVRAVAQSSLKEKDGTT